MLPLIQIASVTGLAGISFLLCWLPACVAIAWTRRGGGRLRFALPVSAIALVAVICACGYARIVIAPKQKSIAVGLVAADKTLSANDTQQRDVALPVVEAYQRRIASLALRGARVVVLPEKFVGVAGDYADAVNALFAETAKTHHVTIIAGFTSFEKPLRNEAAIYEFPTNLRLRYYKRHMVPGWESDFAPGDAPLFMQVDGTRAGVAICKDMDFPQWLRAYGRSDTRILFVPAWDFRRDARLHSRMAAMRGVENGFSVVRTAQEGNLTVSDAYGRVVTEERSGKADEVLLLGSAPLGPGATVYSKLGDWFAIICAVGTVGLCWVIVRQRNRTA